MQYLIAEIVFASWWHQAIGLWAALIALCDQYPLLYTLVVWPAATGAISFFQNQIAPRFPKVWGFFQRTGLDLYGVWLWARNKFPRYVPAVPPNAAVVEKTETETIIIQEPKPVAEEPMAAPVISIDKGRKAPPLESEMPVEKAIPGSDRGE